VTEMAVQNSEIRQTALKPWALYRGGFVRDPVSREMGQGALVVRMRSENCKPKPEVLTGGSWSSQLLNPVGDKTIVKDSVRIGMGLPPCATAIVRS